ncbi:MAG: hypothetical protein VB031_02695 [Eubacteriaceae bacterium]|nr:hypothetical protein [Eubacteriaceae bacterium]
MRKKLLAFVLAAVVAVAMAPMAVFAAPGTAATKVTVNGTEVSGYFEDHKGSFSNGRLILENYAPSADTLIEANGDLNVTLRGANSFSTATAEKTAFKVDGNVTVTGEAGSSLAVSGTDTGINTTGSFVITGGTVSATGTGAGSYGIKTGGKISVTYASVTGTGKANGINASGQELKTALGYGTGKVVGIADSGNPGIIAGSINMTGDEMVADPEDGKIGTSGTDATVTDKAGAAASSAAISYAAPFIKTDAAGDATYLQGETAKEISVIAGGSGLDYQWYSNDVNEVKGASEISNATKSTYTPLTSEVGDRYYFCEVSNSVKKVDSSIVRIKVGPLAPANVKAYSGTFNSIDLSWDAVNGATGYMIYGYDSAAGTYKQIKTIMNGASAGFTNVGLTTGAEYSYTVMAFRDLDDSSRLLSGMSSSVSAKPLLGGIDKIKLYKKGKYAVKVKWSGVSGSSGYKVYRAKSKKGKYKLVKTVKKGKTISWMNKKLKKGKKYYYKVKAYRNVGGKAVVYGSYSKIKSIKR